ncbi:unnamed protein product [Allacma fusca]|uniref:Lipase domain-containing protein n=1 Tax=Allacma fusca TaxID=39272 RepID=A0A8J2PKS0_9HEXA|nr:unnamed protein product [Allacma fusca]
MYFYLFILPLLLGTNGAEESPEENSILDDTELFLIKAMSTEGMKEAFGESSVRNAVEYDSEAGDYAGLSKVSHKNVQFVMYTRENTDMDNGTEIYIGLKDHLLTYGYNPSAPTKIICHGFNSDYKNGPGGQLVPAYFNATPSTQPINIISINWASMAGLHKEIPPEKPIIPNGQAHRQWYDIFYFPPARNTEIVGNLTGALVQFLVQNMGANVKDFHLIGHSLGAHVMGYTGRFVQEKLGMSVARITGLDPAGPCFESYRFACFRGTFIPINRTNADFVDIIHTNAGRFGMTRPVGHVDFYPNNGHHQPGCPGWWRPTSRAICAHTRSVKLMKDSILFPKFAFRSLECPTWAEFSDGVCKRDKRFVAVMGEDCSPKTRGIYFLKTGDRDPFNVGVSTI